MKMLFKKFMASAALDRGGKSNQQPGTGEEGRFEESLRTMDGELREVPLRASIPADLHTSIMRSVRRASAAAEPERVGFAWWRLAVTALVLLVGVGAFWVMSRPNGTGTSGVLATGAQPSFAAAFAQGHELTQAAPQAVVQPLAGEMDLLNRDFQNAVAFVTASLP